MSDTQSFPTQPLPTMSTVQLVEPKRRKRHRGLVALIVIVVILALLVVGFIVGDRYARTYATNYVREKVATAVGLKSTAPVHVSLGSGSIILQAISGSLDDAKVTVDPLTVQGVTGSAKVTATGVPLDSNKPVRTMDVALTVPTKSIQSQLEKSIPQLKQLGAKFSVSGKHIVVGIKLHVLGFITIPVSASVTPGVAKDGPTFTLDTVTISGQKASADALNRVFPGFLSTLKSGKSICIANFLPKEFTLTGVSLHGSSLTYVFTGDGAKLNDSALSVKGTCPKN
jgi:hypothetical protein